MLGFAQRVDGEGDSLNVFAWFWAVAGVALFPLKQTRGKV